MLTKARGIATVASLLGLALAALPASAAAVIPRGGHYAQSKDNVIVATFDVRYGKVRNFSHNDACGTLVPVPPIKIGQRGGFFFSGMGITTSNGLEYTVKVKGKAETRTLIAGSVTFEKTACNGPPCTTITKFRVRRTGPAHT